MFPEPFIDLTLGLKLAGRGGPNGIRALQAAGVAGCPR